MSKRSAGLLLYRRQWGVLEVFLVHPGGPFYANRDGGNWSVPKGECDPGEDAPAAARREFNEETGFTARGPLLPLTPLKQKSGKLIEAFACEGEADPYACISNTFAMEWPPHSGQTQEFPEVDRCAWFTLPAAKDKIHPGQKAFIDELARLLEDSTGEGS
jgi:predicted NUDIX family NTP pyrophosphohydrolase